MPLERAPAPDPMTTTTTDSITLGDGKYTVELGTQAGRFSFTALRNGQPWRDMSGDGDGLMLAMFHQLLEQKERIAQLEGAAAKRLARTMRRWDVEDGSTEALEAEPSFTITADLDRGMLEVLPAGLSAEEAEGLPQLLVSVEIDRGVPRVQIYSDTVSGEVAAQYYAMPNGKLVSELWLTPDIQAIGEQIRNRVAGHTESPESYQAPRA